jgi:hypothetical protein
MGQLFTKAKRAVFHLFLLILNPNNDAEKTHLKVIDYVLIVSKKSCLNGETAFIFNKVSCPEIAIHKKYPNGRHTRTTLHQANPKRLFDVF